MGKAVELAGGDARRQIVELAMEHFECPEDAIRLKDGEAIAGGKRITYGELIHKHFAMQGGELVGTGYAHSGMAPTPANPLFWEIGIGAVEVSVDRETGNVHVEKYVTAADAGKALHPLQCEGQDEGSAMMGFGHTFYETYHYDGGQIINSTLIDYKVPTFDDVPDEFESILIEDGNGPGPYGAKGLGEGGIIPVAPAPGASINPARTVGPMLVQQLAGGAVKWSQLPVYLAAELLAGVAAALVYGLVSRTAADRATSAVGVDLGYPAAAEAEPSTR